MAGKKDKVDDPQQQEAQADETTDQETPAAEEDPAAADDTYKRPEATTRKPLSRRPVYVTDSRNGQKLSHPVPEHFLDQFPYLKLTPSKNKKAGK